MRWICVFICPGIFSFYTTADRAYFNLRGARACDDLYEKSSRLRRPTADFYDVDIDKDCNLCLLPPLAFADVCGKQL